MNEIAHEIVSAFEYVRTHLHDIKVSDTVKEQLDSILHPIFSDPTSCQRITSAINNLGDFSENVLNPILEQYVGSHTATKLKYAIEDLLVSIEKYRDYHLKKANTKLLPTSGIPGVKGTRLGNRGTNLYRNALNKPQAPKHRLKSVTTAINASAGSLHELHRLGSLKGEGDKICGLIYDPKLRKIRDSDSVSMPQIKRSGQVLVKVSSVGLNMFDFEKIKGKKSTVTVFNNNIATMRSSFSAGLGTLRNSFRMPRNLSSRFEESDINLVNSSSPNLLSTSGVFVGSGLVRSRTTSALRNKPSNDSDEVVGIEFCGVVQDIGWSKGDYLHMLPVAREQHVYGVLANVHDLLSNLNEVENGCLAEYVVCDVRNLIKSPRGITDRDAASLAVDGAVVCRTLAETDVNNLSNVAVIGACTNAGHILVELLLHDLNIRIENLYVFVTTEQMKYMSEKGFVHVYDIFDIATRTKEELSSTLLTEIADQTFDDVFDCICGTNLAKRVSFEKLLVTKMKLSSQYFKLDPTKLLAEKEAASDGWQKELALLNKLYEDKKISFDHADHDVIRFDEDAVEEAFEKLQSGETSGKLVVNVSLEEVSRLKERLAAEK